MKVGTPRFSGNQKNYFNLIKGENRYRILPPLGKNAESGTWAVYYKVHYGYRGSDGKMKPFASPEVVNRKTKMIEVPDPAKNRIELMKAKLQEARLAGNKEVERQLAEKLENFNLNGRWYVNAVNDQGQIGLLKIPHRAKQALDAEIKKLQNEGVQPLSLEAGRFFTFTRTGEGRDTLYQVTPTMETVEIPGHGKMSKPKGHSMSIQDLIAMEAQVSNLESLFKTPTPEQIADMVENGAAGVDRTFSSVSQSSESDDSGDDDEPLSSGATSSTIASASLAPVTAQASVEIKGGSAVPVAQPLPSQQVSASQKSSQTSVDFSKMSEADFNAFLNS